MRDRITEYYEECYPYFKIGWHSHENLCLHYGYHDNGRGHDKALARMIEVLSREAQIMAKDRVLDAGYRSIGAFLPRTVAFWADLSRWPMNVNGEPIFTPGQPVQAEINYAYHIVENRQRYAELWGKIWPL